MNMSTQVYVPHLPGLDEDINLQNDIDKLNYLLRMEHNAIRGYEHAMEDIADENLKTSFDEYRRAHSERGTRLSNMINALSGQPIVGGSIAGALHRNWLDLKASAADDNAEAVLEAVVFGERNLDDAYEDLLENGKLESPDVHESVARLHEEAHALRQTTESLAETHGASVS